MLPMLRWSPTADRNALPNLIMALRGFRVRLDLHGDATTYTGRLASFGGDLITLDTGDGVQVQVAAAAVSCITIA